MMIDLAACMARLDREGLLPNDVLAVFCVGSVARGWANDRSDYDFCVVTEQPCSGPGPASLSVPLRPAAVPIHILPVDGRRWELKYWADAQVDQMMAKVGWERFDSAARTAKAVSEVEELFLERLLTCLPLAGHSWVAGRQEALRDSAFRAFAVTRSLAESDNAIEDALGQVAADDMYSAVLSARNALGFTIDALLESHGSFGACTPKWRARRFLEASPAVISFDRYWALETMANFDSSRPRDWVMQVISTCREIEMEIEV